MKKIVLLTFVSFVFLSFTSLGQEYYLGATQPDGFQSGDQIEVPPTNAPAAVNCLPCALPEGEADLTTGPDVVNGGCNSVPPVFIEINIGDVYCGRTNTYGGSSRDTDWYRITLTEEKTLYWTSIADFNSSSYIVGDNGNCSPYVIGDGSASAGVVGQTSATLPPGTYYFFMAYETYYGLDGGADYQVVLSEGPPADPWCSGGQPVPVSNWAIILGVLMIGTFIVIRYRRERLA